jgi:hypothetical protein
MGDDEDAGDLFEGGDWGDVSAAAGANESPPVGSRRVACAPSIGQGGGESVEAHGTCGCPAPRESGSRTRAAAARVSRNAGDGVAVVRVLARQPPTSRPASRMVVRGVRSEEAER